MKCQFIDCNEEAGKTLIDKETMREINLCVCCYNEATKNLRRY